MSDALEQGETIQDQEIPPRRRILHSQDETRRITEAAIEILRENPSLTSLTLFREAQIRALEPARHRRTTTLPLRVYGPIYERARAALSEGVVPVVPGVAGSAGVDSRAAGDDVTPGTPGGPVGVGASEPLIEAIAGLTEALVDQAAGQHTLETVALSLIQAEIQDLNHTVRSLSRLAPGEKLVLPAPESSRELPELRQEIQDLKQALAPVPGEIQLLKQEIKNLNQVVFSFQETLARILGDLTGYDTRPEPPGKPETPAPAILAVPESPKLKIAVVGLLASQLREVSTAINGSARLTMIETGKRLDNQVIKNCDFVVMSPYVRHSDVDRAKDVVGRDKVVRTSRRGVGSLIDTVKGLITPTSGISN